jgi:Lrp/AsnC family transcriptional regulator, regulator for asnA, asnC and gidA
VPAFPPPAERVIFQPDDLDRSILRILMRDANVPYTDIARELAVSGGTIHVRMKKMQEAGVVQGARLVVSPTALGFDITAFIGVYFDKGSAYTMVREQIMQIPEVIESHYTTGLYSMFLKVICRDTRHLRQVLNEKIQRIDGVQRTETFISLEESVQRELSL